MGKEGVNGSFLFFHLLYYYMNKGKIGFVKLVKIWEAL